MKEIKLNIKGMHCEGCSSRLERILKNLDGVKDASVSLENKSAIITFDESVITENSIKETILDGGFEGE